MLVGQARNPIFDSMTPLFMYNYKLSIKETWVTLCILTNSRVGTLTHGFSHFTSQITLLSQKNCLRNTTRVTYRTHSTMSCIIAWAWTYECSLHPPPPNDIQSMTPYANIKGP